MSFPRSNNINDNLNTPTEKLEPIEPSGGSTWSSTMIGKNNFTFFNQNLNQIKKNCSNSLASAYRKKIISTVHFAYGLDLRQEGADCGVNYSPNESDMNRLEAKEKKLEELSSSIRNCMSRS